MLSDEFAQKIIQAAAEEEKRRGEKIPKIYVVGESFYFDEWLVEGLKIDYTLVRSDMDPNFPSDINTDTLAKHKRQKLN